MSIYLAVEICDKESKGHLIFIQVEATEKGFCVIDNQKRPLILGIGN